MSYMHLNVNRNGIEIPPSSLLFTLAFLACNSGSLSLSSSTLSTVVYLISKEFHIQQR